MDHQPQQNRHVLAGMMLAGLMLAGMIAIVVLITTTRNTSARSSNALPSRKIAYSPREPVDTVGFASVVDRIPQWAPDTSLEDMSRIWQRVGYRNIEEIDRALSDASLPDLKRAALMLSKATFFNFEGEPNRGYEVLQQARSLVQKNDQTAQKALYTIIFFQGVNALRAGETDNCVLCRGESSCILPITPAAVHTNPTGSRGAISHFTEYLEQFPDDLDVRWLLNLAHMTLGEYPQKVDPKYLISLDHYLKSAFDIGKFRDIGEKAGVNRFNQAGGAVMEDFDGDGLLDLAVTTYDPTEPMAYYHNMGNGAFEDRTESAGLTKQLGGKNLVQTDFNNDGHPDLFISRGAWMPFAVRQSLLQNNGDGTFTDVTSRAGLLGPMSSTHSCWADFDNDGWLDVYVLGETQANRLYHNRGNGTFEDVSTKAGVGGDGVSRCKGADWIDFDNDDYPDLFVDYLKGDARLYHNNRNGTFSDVTSAMGINGPRFGFSCWAWDYDNDGWLDIFATCFDYTTGDVVKGLMGQPHNRLSNRLFHNLNGKGFEDKTKEAGLDMVFMTMGSNFGDFDNDGFLDMYLGTGDPELTSLVPNRMLKNVAGQRFADITASSGTGSLQKGHGVSCADWDRDGDVDIFIEMGGVSKSDRYHNTLFQNPGQGNHWLTVKLIGKKTNRPALGARIKVVTSGDHPLTIHRHVSTGSSWGANPFQQTIGLAKRDRIAAMEIYWPTSKTTQVFHDITADQAIEVTEFADTYRKLDWKPIPVAK
jgi:FG-GAP-like repeat/ASPIC and UnbV